MAQDGTNTGFFFSNMYETVNGYKYFRILLHFGNRILLDLLIFFFYLKLRLNWSYYMMNRLQVKWQKFL